MVREDKPKLYRTIEEIVQTIVKVSATKARGAKWRMFCPVSTSLRMFPWVMARSWFSFRSVVDNLSIRWGRDEMTSRNGGPGGN